LIESTTIENLVGWGVGLGVGERVFVGDFVMDGVIVFV